MGELLKRFLEYWNNTPEEQLEKDWKPSGKWDGVKPTLSEYWKMSAQNLIISRLKAISSEIKGIKIRYAYDEITDFHIIEISPESIRRGSKEYIELENELSSDFYKSFPSEDILISGALKSNNMSNIIFEI